MSALAPALLDSLRRLVSTPTSARLDGTAELALQQVVTALCGALERGELALDLEGPPPEGIAAEESEPASLETVPEAQPDSSRTTRPSPSKGPGAAISSTTSSPAGSSAPAWPEAHLAALAACG